MAQLSLFPSSTVRVPDLGYVEGYVGEADAAALLAAIDAQPWLTDWQRRVQRYGASYGNMPSLGPIPAFLDPLGARLVHDGHLAGPPANVTINEYLPGQGIAPHKDYAPFGDAIAAVSLGAPYLLDWIAPDGGRASIDVAPRSLFVFRGEARWKWMHGIAPRRSDVIDGEKRPRGRRVSVTFRTLGEGRPAAARTTRNRR